MSKPTLAILIDWYVPGFKAGGPIRSVANLAHLLQKDCDIYIFTSDRDAGDAAPYPHIRTDCWTELQPGIRVWYASPDKHKQIETELRSLSPEAIHLNSMFSVPFTINPIRWHLRRTLSKRVVLAPRGMLHAGAIQYGMRKKRLFIRAMRMMGAHKKVVWQATDAQEAEDIHVHLGKKSEIRLVGNVPTSDLNATAPQVADKVPGKLNMVFVSRIQPKKNLDFLLKRLLETKGEVTFDLIGPVEDEQYWAECQAIIRTMPPTISVNYLGPMPHPEIIRTIKQYHLFALTTHGENFGHAIFDALLCGLPVLLSDQTPWKRLESQKAGWAIPLDREQQFTEALGRAISWTQEAYEIYSTGARKLARNYLESSRFRTDYLELFFPDQSR